MLNLLLILLAQPQFVACGCQCVAGVPKTLCQTVEEAQQRPRLCAEEIRCPVDEPPPVAVDAVPHFFDAPSDQAHTCREVRTWDQQQAAYTGVKVCDVYAS
jgi:hypothetical protein